MSDRVLIGRCAECRFYGSLFREEPGWVTRVTSKVCHNPATSTLHLPVKLPPEFGCIHFTPSEAP